RASTGAYVFAGDATRSQIHPLVQAGQHGLARYPTSRPVEGRLLTRYSLRNRYCSTRWAWCELVYNGAPGITTPVEVAHDRQLCALVAHLRRPPASATALSQ